MEIKIKGVSSCGRFYLTEDGKVYDAKEKKLKDIQKPKYMGSIKIPAVKPEVLYGGCRGGGMSCARK